MFMWLGGGIRQWSLRAQLEGRLPFYLGSFFEAPVHAWLGCKPSSRKRVRVEEADFNSLMGADPTISAKQMAITPEQFRFFLDSGAFSAWTRGTAIDIDEYCEFIRANIERLDVYAALDVIPGKLGQIATHAEREEAAEQSWANYLYMRRAGLDPLPVFHYGEDWRFLDRMLKYGCDYVGIGGLVGVPGQRRRVWLDALFDILTDAEGRAKIKTHGFGMTSIPLIFRYPWYSVDSTTWLRVTASGAVLMPAVRGGAFTFDEVPETITVSDQNPKRMQDAKHANSLSTGAREHLDEWLAMCGKTFTDVQTNYYHRATVNVSFFRRVSESKAEHRFARNTRRVKGLL